MQNSPFSSLTVAVTIASRPTHCPYPRRDGQAELAWVAALRSEIAYPKAVTHPSTNRARYRATALIKTNALALHQTGSYGDGGVINHVAYYLVTVTRVYCIGLHLGVPACVQLDEAIFRTSLRLAGCMKAAIKHQ